MAKEDVGGLPVIKIEVIMEAEPALPSIVDVGMGARIGSAVGGGTTTCTVSLPPFPPRTMAATRIIAAVTTAPKPPNSNQTGIPPMRPPPAPAPTGGCRGGMDGGVGAPVAGVRPKAPSRASAMSFADRTWLQWFSQSHAV